MSPWRIPAFILKMLVDLNDYLAFCISSLWQLLSRVVCYMTERFSTYSPMYRIEVFNEIYKTKEACRLIDLAPSMFRRSDKICPTVDRFFRKSFRFFRRNFSTSAYILLIGSDFPQWRWVWFLYKILHILYHISLRKEICSLLCIFPCILHYMLQFECWREYKWHPEFPNLRRNVPLH